MSLNLLIPLGTCTREPPIIWLMPLLPFHLIPFPTKLLLVMVFLFLLPSTISFSSWHFFFRLYDVLHVPSLCKNLMSIAQLTHDLLVSIIFYPWGYVICDLHSSKILFQGQCKDGLYHVLPYSSPSHGSKQALISIPHPPSGIIISDIPLIVFLEI